MTRTKAAILISLLLLVPFLSPVQATSIAQDQGKSSIRPSILAGSWYPASADTLRKTVLRYVGQATVPVVKGTLRAIIVPHAGYRYSGQVAAYAYKLLQSHPFTRIILVGPSHRIPFAGVSVNLQHGYQTPLGIVKVDLKTARTILNADPAVHWYKDAHAVEHSLEIQLPFLQTVLKNFTIVPILMGSQDYETCNMLARVLSRIMPSLDNTLLLASSDLSHYHDYSTAKALDARFIELVKDMNPRGLYEALRTGQCEACGGGPVISILLACQALEANRVLILKTANSGDVTGVKDRVVGYMAGAIVTSSGMDQRPE